MIGASVCVLIVLIMACRFNANCCSASASFCISSGVTAGVCGVDKPAACSKSLLPMSSVTTSADFKDFLKVGFVFKAFSKSADVQPGTPRFVTLNCPLAIKLGNAFGEALVWLGSRCKPKVIESPSATRLCLSFFSADAIDENKVLSDNMT